MFSFTISGITSFLSHKFDPQVNFHIQSIVGFYQIVKKEKGGQNVT